MKKLIALSMAALCVAASLAGCSSSSTSEESSAASASTSAASAESSAAASGESTEGMSGAISVVSREDGSGTRGAFIELMGVEEKDESGNKVDKTVDTAEITNSTAVMMTTIAGNPAAIGYISLGSLNDSVKALQIDGTEATVDNIKNGTYKVARPFNIVTKSDVSETAQDFINFIMSDEGQAVVEENGYVSNGSTGAFAGGEVSGKVTWYRVHPQIAQPAALHRCNTDLTPSPDPPLPHLPRHGLGNRQAHPHAAAAAHEANRWCFAFHRYPAAK